MEVASMHGVTILLIFFLEKQFTENIWRRNRDQNPTYKSPSKILWIWNYSQSYFEKYQRSRRHLSRRSLGTNRIQRKIWIYRKDLKEKYGSKFNPQLFLKYYVNSKLVSKLFWKVAKVQTTFVKEILIRHEQVKRKIWKLSLTNMCIGG